MRQAGARRSRVSSQVFSWWTGGGEAAGLTKLIAIWNKTNTSCQFKNETVAGGAGSNAKAVLAQRLSAKNPPDSFQGHAGKELLDYIKAGQVEPIDFIYKQYKLRQGLPQVADQPDQLQGPPLLGAGEHPPRQHPLVQPGRPEEGRRRDAADDRGTQFIAALEKVKASTRASPRSSLGEQWTQKHLLETVMIATLGPSGWAKLWTKGGDWNSPGVTTAINRFNDAADEVHELRRRVADVAGRGQARDRRQGRVQHHGRLAGRLLQRHDRRWQPRQEAEHRLRLAAPCPAPDGVFDWLSDSFTLPKGAPHRAAAVKWLGLPRQQAGAGHVQPGQGLDPGPPGREREPLRPVPASGTLGQWKTEQAGRLAGARRRRRQRLEHGRSTRRSACSSRTRTWRRSRRRSSPHAKKHA